MSAHIRCRSTSTSWDIQIWRSDWLSPLDFPFHATSRLPYRSLSITEFWRRWHMTLSAWFRDYVYIPLGGSRSSNARTYINLGTVFLLCGLWHGANWTFLIWGIHHGVFLIFERAGLSQGLRLAPRAVAWSYALFVVMTGWVWFRAKDFFHAVEMFKAMAGFNGFSSLTFSTQIVLYPSTLMASLFGIAFSLFVLPPLRLGPVFSAIADTPPQYLRFSLCPFWRWQPALTVHFFISSSEGSWACSRAIAASGLPS